MVLRLGTVVSPLGAMSIAFGALVTACGSSTEDPGSPGIPDAHADASVDTADDGAPPDISPDDTGADRSDSGPPSGDSGVVDRRDVGPSNPDSGLDASRMDVTVSDGGSTPPSDASTDGGGTLCSTLGWCEIANTKLESVCPRTSPGGTSGCSSVINAWSGAAADIDNNQLYIWGGGHDDYHGNEVYALDLAALRMKRLNEPSPASAIVGCDDKYTDGLPSSRHTYDGLAFLPGEKALFAFGGSKSKCGFLTNDTWTFS
ncbi:MAG: hypothetical protein ABW133_04030, partial [Polyangiaceae bacterium]